MVSSTQNTERADNRNSAGHALQAVMFGGGQGLMYYTFAAQQELLWLGANFIKRQSDIGRRIAMSRDFSEMATVYNQFAQETTRDLRAAANRLLDYGCEVGLTVSRNAEHGYRDLARTVKEELNTGKDFASSVAGQGERVAESMSAPSRKQEKGD